MTDNETIADIIAEKRREANYIVQIAQGKCHTRRDKAEDEARDIRREADRLEAAYKREIDVLKQRCAELDAEVAAKDEVIKRLNDAIAEDQRRKMAAAENSSAVGDTAKLREALKATLGLFFDIHNANRSPQSNQAYAVIRKIKAALAAPPRNCDVGTAEEQDERFHRFCVMQRKGSCAGCPDPVGGRTVANGIRECALVWAQMPYEGGAK